MKLKDVVRPRVGKISYPQYFDIPLTGGKNILAHHNSHRDIEHKQALDFSDNYNIKIEALSSSNSEARVPSLKSQNRKEPRVKFEFSHFLNKHMQLTSQTVPHSNSSPRVDSGASP